MRTNEERTAQLLNELEAGPKRKTVRQVVESHLEDVLEGTLDQAVIKMELLRDQYGADAKIEVKHEYESTRLCVYKERHETDAEWMRRRAEEIAAEDALARREMETLQRLQAKYGKDTT